MKFLSDLLVQGDGNEIFLKSADHNISRIIPRGTGANLDKGLFSLFDTGAEDVRIDTAGVSWFNGGNIGIGTASPSYKLHVQGSNNGNINTTVENTNTGTNAYATYRLKNNSINTAALFLNGSNNTAYSGANSLNMYQGGNHPLGFVTSNQTRMTVTGGGNVGIGTTSPGAKLDVAGSAPVIRLTDTRNLNVGDWDDVSLGKIQFYTSDTTSPGARALAEVEAYSGAAAASGPEAELRFKTSDINDASPVQRMVIDAQGRVGIGTTSPSYILDVSGTARLKSNVSELIVDNSTYSEMRYGTSNYFRADGSQATINGPIIKLTVGGTEKMRVHSNGNVGIGTTSPQAKLDVSSTSNVVVSLNSTDLFTFLDLYNDGINRVQVGNASDGDFIVRTSDTERMRITSTGNVGIGTASPAEKLDVSGNIKSTGLKLAVNTSMYTEDATLSYYSASNAVYLNGAGNDGWLRLNASGASNDSVAINLFGTSAGNYQTFKTNSAERMRIDSSGNVGIGTTSPARELHVKGNNGWGEVRVEGQTFASGHGASLEFYSEGTALADIYASTDKHLYFRTNGSTERMRITSAGNVGIGATSPSNTLSVNGIIGIGSSDQTTLSQTSTHFFMDMTSSTSYFRNTSTAGGGFIFRNSNIGDFEFDNEFAGNIKFNTSNVERMRINSSGNVGIGTTNPTEKLAVDGNIETTNPVGKIGFNVGDAYGDFPHYGLGKSNGANPVNLSGYYGLTFGSNGTERMRITSTGNVGIGTASPSTKLHVVDTGSTSVTHYLKFNNENSSYGGLTIGSTGDDLKIRQNAGYGYFDATGYSFNYGTGRVWMNNGSILDVRNSSNSTVFYIPTSGNVGIGTTSPATVLDVVGEGTEIEGTGYYYNARFKDTANVGVLIGHNNTSNGNGMIAGVNKLAFLTYGTDWGERMVIDGDGNVGIGTTSPQSQLHIYKSNSGGIGGELRLDNNNAAVGNKTRILFSDGGGGSASFDRAAIVAQTEASPYKGQLQFQTGYATLTTKMIITGDGNVGIGTTSPSQKLHVAGNIQLTDKANSILFGSSGVDGTWSAPKITRIGTKIIVSDYSGVQFGGFDGSAYGARMTVLGTGNVGVGTTSPSQKLEVNGNIKIGDAQKSLYGTGDDLQIYHDGSNSYISDTGTGDLYLLASDNVYFQTHGSGKRWITLNENASVDLFYNDSKKLETTSTGVAVTGKITNLTAGTGNLDAVNVQQLNNATTGALIYKGTWSAAPTTTSVLDGAVSSAGTIVIDAPNPGISVGATITGTGISGTVTVSNIAADGITIAISSPQTIANGTTLTFTTVGGTPDLSQASRKVTGHYYICETAGAVTPNGAGTTPNEWAVGDWVTFSDLTTDAWQKIDNSSVLSGAGTGGKVPVWSGSGTSVTLADAPITVSGSNATFAGDVLVEDNLYLTDAGTVRGKIQLNSSDRDNLDIKATSLGSLMRFYTVDTLALTLDSSQNATFAGDVTLSSTGPLLYLANTTSTTGKTWRFSSAANGKFFITQEGVVDAVTLDHTTGNASFAGSIYANTIYSATNSAYYIDVNSTGVGLNTAGGATFAGDVSLVDDKKLILGTGSDLKIYHEGTDSIIQNYTGSIYIDNNADNQDIVFRADDGSGGLATYMYLDGSITETRFTKPTRHDDGVIAKFGNGNDLNIYHDGSNSYIDDTGTGDLYIRANNLRLANADGSGQTINANNGGNVELFHNNSKKLETTSTGASITGALSTTSDATFGGNGVFTGYVNTTLVFGTTDLNLGYAGGTSGVFIKGSTALAGNVGIGTTAPKSKLQVNGGIQMAGDTAAASADKVGTMRYRTGTEYVEVNGTELVTNGDFSGGSQDWTKEAGWSIASGKASYDASSATNALYQNIGLTTGSVYKLSFTVVDYTSGSFKAHLSNGNVSAATDAISANGNYSFNITATGALVLFRNVTSFNGSIDNVSVIEVTAEDASYADMCMQTGASTYEWVNIVRNTY